MIVLINDEEKKVEEFDYFFPSLSQHAQSLKHLLVVANAENNFFTQKQVAPIQEFHQLRILNIMGEFSGALINQCIENDSVTYWPKFKLRSLSTLPILDIDEAKLSKFLKSLSSALEELTIGVGDR